MTFRERGELWRNIGVVLGVYRDAEITVDAWRFWLVYQGERRRLGFSAQPKVWP